MSSVSSGGGIQSSIGHNLSLTTYTCINSVAMSQSNQWEYDLMVVCPESVPGSTCVISEFRLECYQLVSQIQEPTATTKLLSVSKNIQCSAFYGHNLYGTTDSCNSLIVYSYQQAQLSARGHLLVCWNRIRFPCIWLNCPYNYEVYIVETFTSSYHIKRLLHGNKIRTVTLHLRTKG